MSSCPGVSPQPSIATRMSEPAFDDEGQIIPSANFDYAAVESALGNSDLFDPESAAELISLTPAEMDAGLKLFRCLLRWMWQNGMRNTDGLTLRAIIVCWVFIEELQPLGLTQMARGYGRYKQSLGRWMDNFKASFPMIKTPHMRYAKRKHRQPLEDPDVMP